MKLLRRHTLAPLAVLALVVPATACGDDDPIAVSMAPVALQTVSVSGTATHYFSTAITHSETPVQGGMVNRSTDIIRLSGGIEGFVLYHPTSQIDFATQTLVNTGAQVFSGSIGGAEPVLLYDDTFRFEVDLTNGATTGRIHLRRSESSPHPEFWWECDLDAVGTGMTPEGDGLADYSGSCTQFGTPAAML